MYETPHTQLENIRFLQNLTERATRRFYKINVNDGCSANKLQTFYWKPGTEEKEKYVITRAWYFYILLQL